MDFPFRPRFARKRFSLLSACLLIMASFGAAGAESPAVFGFTGPESFPIDGGIAQLRAADLDGDGLVDLVLANNSKAKVTLLLNRTGKPPEAARVSEPRRDINELPPDARFKIDSITSEKRISAMVVADLNGDKRPDILYVGEPKPLELVVHYNQGGLTWSVPKRWQIDDAQLAPEGLAVGDLNGDGLPDVAILCDFHVALLRQSADHTLSEPEKISFTGGVKSLRIQDVDGDGRADLVLSNPENPNPVRFRLQGKSGELGPELHFALPPIRSLMAEDLDNDSRAELVTISQTSGRASVANLVRKPGAPLTAGFQQGQFQVLPLGKTSKSRRGLAWGDVDGDGRTDLLVAQPETGQITLYLQDKGGGLGKPRVFPSLAGITDVAVLPAGAGRSAEVYVLSADERQIGRTTLGASGRLEFPTALALEGKPLSMEVGVVSTGAPPVLVCILDSSDRRVLAVAQPGGGFKSQKLSTAFKSNPSAVLIHDINQDGLPDIVVLIPYEKLKVLMQVPGKDYEEIDLAPPGGAVDQPWAVAADVDGDQRPELLLGQKNFIRAVHLVRAEGGEWSLAVKDQINGVSPSSRIIGAAALRPGAEAPESLFLLDADRKALSLCARSAAGSWQIERNIPLPFSDFTDLLPLAVGSARPNCVGLMGSSAVGWLRLDGEMWELAELDGYETPVKDGRLSQAAAGDLNHDGRKDIVLLETSRNHIDIVSFNRARKLVPGNRWQVFEERTFRSRRGEGTEPREAVVADLNHDGRDDLAVVVHDRVLVYLQQ